MNRPRVILVTGAAQNIGAAIAARFLEDEASVVCADLQPPANTAVEFIAADVASEAKCDCPDGARCCRFRASGCAGEQRRGLHRNGHAETTEADWDWVMAVNVKTLLTTKHALPLMRADGADNPAIVNISSIEGLGANPLHSVYAASKAAVAAFTHNTALEYGPYGIRCNAVAPGWINTPFNEQLLAQYPDREAVDAAIEALHPVGRLGSPEDVANTVYWLASPEAGFITGQEVIVDGGRLAKLPLPAL